MSVNSNSNPQPDSRQPQPEYREETCTQCNGKGTLPCETCERSGCKINDWGDVVFCGVCDGYGERECKMCKGTGNIEIQIEQTPQQEAPMTNDNDDGGRRVRLTAAQRLVLDKLANGYTLSNSGMLYDADDKPAGYINSGSTFISLKKRKFIEHTKHGQWLVWTITALGRDALAGETDQEAPRNDDTQDNTLNQSRLAALQRFADAGELIRSYTNDRDTVERSMFDALLSSGYIEARTETKPASANSRRYRTVTVIYGSLSPAGRAALSRPAAGLAVQSRVVVEYERVRASEIKEGDVIRHETDPANVPEYEYHNLSEDVVVRDIFPVRELGLCFTLPDVQRFYQPDAIVLRRIDGGEGRA